VQYEVSALLGAGGMGEVYAARDTRLERDVAIKVLPPGDMGDEDSRRRLIREARLAARLNHPHIATIHGARADAGRTQSGPVHELAPFRSAFRHAPPSDRAAGIAASDSVLHRAGLRR
jgi:serine/threonine protein kinase